jgi:peptide-methionine (S)-S-oxide reductase
VGYAGGTTSAPTYHSIGDHTEVFQVDFDPETVSYEELLQFVWTSHDPTRPAFKTQYASLILAHDDEQFAAAQESASRLSDAIGRPLATRIERLDRFWVAEDYHQKYYLRQDRIRMAEFRAMFGGDDTALRESTEAGRVNGRIYTGAS